MSISSLFLPHHHGSMRIPWDCKGVLGILNEDNYFLIEVMKDMSLFNGLTTFFKHGSNYLTSLCASGCFSSTHRYEQEKKCTREFDRIPRVDNTLTTDIIMKASKSFHVI